MLIVCENPDCKKLFNVRPCLAEKRKYCSRVCATEGLLRRDPEYAMRKANLEVLRNA